MLNVIHSYVELKIAAAANQYNIVSRNRDCLQFIKIGGCDDQVGCAIQYNYGGPIGADDGQRALEQVGQLGSIFHPAAL